MLWTLFSSKLSLHGGVRTCGSFTTSPYHIDWVDQGRLNYWLTMSIPDPRFMDMCNRLHPSLMVLVHDRNPFIDDPCDWCIIILDHHIILGYMISLLEQLVIQCVLQQLQTMLQQCIPL
jgi:hypothetical protein